MKRFAALLATTATAALAFSAAPALATTTTYNCAGSAASWTVPAGVTSLSYIIKGAGGGNGGSGDSGFWTTNAGGNGGTGALFSGTWSVTTGQSVSIKVGCKGGTGADKRDGNGGASGGWGWFTGGNGGNAGNRNCGFFGCSKSATGGAGGGGGASGIGIGSLFVVAGGGGGGGGGAYWAGGGGSAYAAVNNGTALANGSNGPKNGDGNGGSGGSGGGGGAAGAAVSGDTTGNGGQNGRSAASSDSAISATLDASGGAARTTDGSITLTFFKPVSVSGAPTGTVGGATQNIAFSYPDTGHTFECKTDSGAWAACTSPISLSGLSDGSHTWQVRPVDSAGNSGAATSKTWTVDITPPPAPKLSGAPSGTVGVNLLAFGFSVTETTATLTCSLDNAAFAPCGDSPKILSGLSEGKHRYVVKATDAYGNSSTAEANWSVDSSAAASVSGDTGKAPSVTYSPNPSGVWMDGFDNCAIAKVNNPGDLVCWMSGKGKSTFNYTNMKAKYEFRVDTDLGGGVVQVAGGGGATCVVMSNGTGKCRGSNWSGLLGDGSTVASSDTWKTIAGLTNIRSIDIGQSNSQACAALADSTVRCWGKNYSGQVTGSESDRYNSKNTPVPVSGLTVPVKKVSAQQDATCALTTSGEAWCWGTDVWNGNIGGDGVGFTVASPRPVKQITSGKPGYICINTATLLCNGGVDTPIKDRPVVEKLTGLVDISSGTQFSCAVKSDGTVWCWGSGESGQLGYGSKITGSLNGAVQVVGITNAVKIASTAYQTCAVLSTGDIKCWGSGFAGDGSGWQDVKLTPITISTATLGGKAVDISLDVTNCATLESGTLKCWGDESGLTTLGRGGSLTPVTVPFGPFVVAAPPAAPIIGVPASPTKSTSASISFKGETGATFSCSVDGGSYSACASPKSLSDLSEGTHSLAVKQTGVGGESPVGSVSWTVNSKLDAPVLSGAPTGTTLATGASLSFTGGSGATFQCSTDGAPYGPCTSPVSLSGLSLDKHSFSVVAIKDGLISSPASANWVVADAVTPTAPTLSGAPTGTSTSRSASITLSGDSGATFECSVDGGAYAACTSPWTSSTLTDGSHTLSVKAVIGGFKSLATDVTWKVDATAPAAPTLVSKPSAQSKSAIASVPFTGESGATFTCSVDGGAYAACTSPWSASGLTEGAHSVAIKATDAAGNTGAAATASWTVDLTAPGAPTLATKPDSVTGSTVASFTFTGETGASFLCQIDSGTPAACSSGDSFSGLAEGNHVAYIKAVDAAGNVGSAATASWKVDLTGPTAPSFITKPDAVVSSTYANFNFAAAAGEPVTYKCSLDGAAYSACTPPASVSGIAPGEHSYRVVAVDAVGNLSLAAPAYWMVGNLPATPTLGSKPSGLTNSTSGSVAFSSTETGVTFQCSVDGGSYSACTSPKAVTGLGGGPHSVSVKAVNSIGGSSAAQATWVVDATAPAAPSVSGSVTGLTRATTQSISWTAESGATVTCSVDGGAYESCARPKTLSSVADGEHSVAVKQTDAAGNTGPSATVSWTVDTTAPSTPVLSGAPSASTTATTASISFTADSSTTVECSLDNGAWGACSSPKSQSGLALGAHVFKVRSTDAAGNVSASGSAEWTIVPPGPPAKPTLSGAPSSLTNSSSASVGFTSDSDATFTCSVDGGAFTACTSPKSLSGLADGVHSLVVKATGPGGSTSNTESWTVDTAAPAAPVLTGAPGGTTNQVDSTIAISAEPGASLTCSLDGGAFAACTSPVSLTGLSEAAHSLSVKATDAAGNTSPAGSASWTVDLTAPSVVLTSNPHGTLKSASASIEFSSSGADSVTCSLDGAAYTACTSPVSLTGLAEGVHSLTIKGVDTAGNVASTTTEKWTVDTVGPTAVFANTVSGVRSGPAETFGVNIEPGATLECKLDSGAWAGCSSTVSFTALTEGNHTLKVRGTDAVGNVGPEATASWYSSVPAAPGSGVTLNMGTVMTATLTTPPGVGTTPVVTYQWQRCATADPSTCTNITGAIARTYTPFSADVGQRVRFSATFTGGGKSVTVWSPISAVVMPSITTAPALTYETGLTAPVKGRFVGTTSGRVEGWTLLPTRLYQWQRCPAAGGACTDIAGATTTIYKVTASDVGFKLKLQYVFKADSVAPLNGFSLNGVTDLTPVITAS